MIDQAYYEFVRNNANFKVRDEFVKAIDLEEYTEHVDKVEYMPERLFVDKLFGKQESLIETLPQKKIMSNQWEITNQITKEICKRLPIIKKIIVYSIISVYEKGMKLNILIKNNPSLKPKLIVYSEAFESDMLKNVEDFKGSLKYHEGFHAKEFNELNPLMINLPKGNLELFNYIPKRELRAYENQIKHINKKNSEKYIEILKESKEKLEEIINNNEKFFNIISKITN